MINVLWAGMIIIGMVYSVFAGTTDKVSAALFDGASKSVELVIGFIAVFTFWLGMMEIAKRTGILTVLAAVFRPALLVLFPELKKSDPALGYISTNLIANMLGLGNAATPAGIKAMQALKESSGATGRPTRSMVTFLCLNTAAITIIPTTVLSIRSTAGAADPSDIIIPAFLASVTACLIALTIDRLTFKAGMWLRREDNE